MRAIAVGVMAGVLALAACTESTGPAGSDDAATTAATLVAVDGVQQGLDLMDVPGGPAGPNRTVIWLDAAGKTQDKYDSLTTATIKIHSVLDHQATREGFSGSIHREGDMTVSGLAGRETQRTWNGSSSGKVTHSATTQNGVTRSFSATESETVANVVRSVDRAAHPWPLSGTVTRKVSVTTTGPNGTETKDVTVVTTFNGTQNPTMTVNGVAHEVDLGDRMGPRPFRRK